MLGFSKGNRKTDAINEILKYKTYNEIDVITEMFNEIGIPTNNLRNSKDVVII